MSSGDPYDGDYLDYQDLTLPLDARLIFDAPPQHFQAVVYVKRQNEILDAAIQCWIRMARECQTGNRKRLAIKKYEGRGGEGGLVATTVTRLLRFWNYEGGANQDTRAQRKTRN